MFQLLRNKIKRNNKASLKNNRAELLEETIRNINRDCSNPIRPYSAEEVTLATTNFLRSIHRDWNYTLYEGIHRDRRIYVKKIEPKDWFTEDAMFKYAAVELSVASRMSSHQNVLRLLGYCLSTEFPILVYEFAENGNLSDRLFNHREVELSWDQKLKIVIETANAIAYLHRGLANTYIHRGIKPGNIFLDRNFSPKLFEFQMAVPVPEGEAEVEAESITGTLGYIDPQVMLSSCCYTEKSDVYGFGVLLCDVLTGKRIHDLYCWYRETVLLDNSASSPTFPLEDFVWDTVEEHCKDYLEGERIRVQVMEYAKLMKRCLEFNSDDRPDIIEAEMELRRIKNL